MARKPRAAAAQILPLDPFDPSVPTEPRQAKISVEQWNEYTLDDGSTIRVRTVLVDVERAKNKFSADGNPLYFLKTAMIVNVKSPPRLRKKKPKKKKSSKRKTPKRKAKR